ncbi:MAG: DUF4386 domain-containing protein [Marinibacterium sp.]
MPDPALPHPTPHLAFPPARMAGALYVLIILSGLTAELALRGPLLAEAPSPFIAAGQARFRLSLGLDLVMALADVALALLLFDLFRPVNERFARAALVFRLIQTSLIAAGLIGLSTAPGLARAGETAALTWLLEAHATGYDIALVFFAVSTALTACLLQNSGRAPRALPAALFAAAAVYATGGFLHLLAPAAHVIFQPAYLVPVLAECAFASWLLVAARL